MLGRHHLVVAFVSALFFVIYPFVAVAQYEDEQLGGAASSGGLEEFSGKFLWGSGLSDSELIKTEKGKGAGTTVSFYQGQDRRYVDTEEAYVLLGGPDLARRYVRRQRSIKVLNGAGGVFVGVGVGMTLYSLLAPGDSGVNEWGTWGASITSLGFVFYFLASTLKPHPIEPLEMRALVQSYNRRLLNDLGVSESELPQEYRSMGVVDLRLDFFHNEKGSGLAVGFQF